MFAYTFYFGFEQVVDPIFAMSHLQSGLKSKSHSLNHTAKTSNDVQQIQQILCETQKLSSPSPSTRPNILTQTSDVNPQVYF